MRPGIGWPPQAAAPHPRGGMQPWTLRTHGRPCMKRPGDPPVTACSTKRPRSHTRVGRTFRLPQAQGRHSRAEGPVMRSVTAMRPAQHRAIPDSPRPTLLLSRAISALTAHGPSASPFHYRCGRPQRLRTATRQRFRWSEPMWSPPPESNRRPHPYHRTTRNRCAEPCLPRSRPTVGAKVIGSLSVKLCVVEHRAADV
jgi:hypothetical protein